MGYFLCGMGTCYGATCNMIGLVTGTMRFIKFDMQHGDWEAPPPPSQLPSSTSALTRYTVLGYLFHSSDCSLSWSSEGIACNSEVRRTAIISQIWSKTSNWSCHNFLWSGVSVYKKNTSRKCNVETFAMNYCERRYFRAAKFSRIKPYVILYFPRSRGKLSDLFLILEGISPNFWLDVEKNSIKKSSRI